MLEDFASSGLFSAEQLTLLSLLFSVTLITVVAFCACCKCCQKRINEEDLEAYEAGKDIKILRLKPKKKDGKKGSPKKPQQSSPSLGHRAVGDRQSNDPLISSKSAVHRALPSLPPDASSVPDTVVVHSNLPAGPGTRESSVSDLYASVDKATSAQNSQYGGYSKINKIDDKSSDISEDPPYSRIPGRSTTYDIIDEDSDFSDALYSKVRGPSAVAVPPDRHQYEYPRFTSASSTTTVTVTNVTRNEENFYSRVDPDSQYSTGGSDDPPYSKIPDKTTKGAPIAIDDEISQEDSYEPGYTRVKQREKAADQQPSVSAVPERNLDNLYTKVQRRSSADSGEVGPSYTVVNKPLPILRPHSSAVDNLPSYGETDGPPPLPHRPNSSVPLPPNGVPPTEPTREPPYRYITVRESLDALRLRMAEQQQRNEQVEPAPRHDINAHYYSTISDHGYEVVAGTSTPQHHLYEDVTAVRSIPPEIDADGYHYVTRPVGHHSDDGVTLVEVDHTPGGSSYGQNESRRPLSESFSGTSEPPAPAPPTSPIPDRSPSSLSTSSNAASGGLPKFPMAHSTPNWSDSRPTNLLQNTTNGNEDYDIPSPIGTEKKQTTNEWGSDNIGERTFADRSPKHGPTAMWRSGPDDFFGSAESSRSVVNKNGSKEVQKIEINHSTPHRTNGKTTESPVKSTNGSSIDDSPRVGRRLADHSNDGRSEYSQPKQTSDIFKREINGQHLDEGIYGRGPGDSTYSSNDKEAQSFNQPYGHSSYSRPNDEGSYSVADRPTGSSDVGSTFGVNGRSGRRPDSDAYSAKGPLDGGKAQKPADTSYSAIHKDRNGMDGRSGRSDDGSYSAIDKGSLDSQKSGKPGDSTYSSNDKGAQSFNQPYGHSSYSRPGNDEGSYSVADRPTGSSDTRSTFGMDGRSGRRPDSDAYSAKGPLDGGKAQKPADSSYARPGNDEGSYSVADRPTGSSDIGSTFGMNGRSGRRPDSDAYSAKGPLDGGKAQKPVDSSYSCPGNDEGSYSMADRPTGSSDIGSTFGMDGRSGRRPDSDAYSAKGPLDGGKAQKPADSSYSRPGNDEGSYSVADRPTGSSDIGSTFGMNGRSGRRPDSDAYPAKGPLDGGKAQKPADSSYSVIDKDRNGMDGRRGHLPDDSSYSAIAKGSMDGQKARIIESSSYSVIDKDRDGVGGRTGQMPDGGSYSVIDRGPAGDQKGQTPISSSYSVIDRDRGSGGGRTGQTADDGSYSIIDKSPIDGQNSSYSSSDKGYFDIDGKMPDDGSYSVIGKTTSRTVDDDGSYSAIRDDQKGQIPSDASYAAISKSSGRTVTDPPKVTRSDGRYPTTADSRSRGGSPSKRGATVAKPGDRISSPKREIIDTFGTATKPVRPHKYGSKFGEEKSTFSQPGDSEIDIKGTTGTGSIHGGGLHKKEKTDINKGDKMKQGIKYSTSDFGKKPVYGSSDSDKSKLTDTSPQKTQSRTTTKISEQKYDDFGREIEQHETYDKYDQQKKSTSAIGDSSHSDPFKSTRDSYGIQDSSDQSAPDSRNIQFGKTSNDSLEFDSNKRTSGEQKYTDGQPPVGTGQHGKGSSGYVLDSTGKSTQISDQSGQRSSNVDDSLTSDLPSHDSSSVQAPTDDKDKIDKFGKNSISGISDAFQSDLSSSFKSTDSSGASQQFTKFGGSPELGKGQPQPRSSTPYTGTNRIGTVSPEGGQSGPVQDSYDSFYSPLKPAVFPDAHVSSVVEPSKDSISLKKSPFTRHVPSTTRSPSKKSELYRLNQDDDVFLSEDRYIYASAERRSARERPIVHKKTYEHRPDSPVISSPSKRSKQTKTDTFGHFGGGGGGGGGGGPSSDYSPFKSTVIQKPAKQSDAGGDDDASTCFCHGPECQAVREAVLNENLIIMETCEMRKSSSGSDS